MNKAKIQQYARSFIANAEILEWSQEAHNAFAASVIKQELGLEPEQVKALMLVQQAMPSLTANASAFRQWLQSKEISLLAKTEQADVLANRYAKFI